jgi:hypothetical protein
LATYLEKRVSPNPRGRALSTLFSLDTPASSPTHRQLNTKPNSKPRIITTSVKTYRGPAGTLLLIILKRACWENVALLQLAK